MHSRQAQWQIPLAIRTIYKIAYLYNNVQRECQKEKEIGGKRMEENVYYLYPGTFDPATFGHQYVVKEVASMCKKLYIVCSVNPEKADQTVFSPVECKELWKSYDLPENVEVCTLEEIMQKQIDFHKVVMVRGVRDDSDFNYEKWIMMENFKELGIYKFLVIMSNEEYKNVSSSQARKLAEDSNMDELCKIVTREVAEKLIEKMNAKKMN